MNEATIGRFTWDGTEYEIDWPFDFEDETVRAGFGAIYRDGKQVGEVCAPLGKSLDSENDVIAAAVAAIMSGEVSDDAS